MKNGRLDEDWIRVVKTAAVSLALALSAACHEPVHEERRWAVMGTYAQAEVHAYDRKTAEKMLQKVRHAFERVDGEMSNWKEDSLLNEVNRKAGKGPFHVSSPDLYRCIRLAYEYAKNTDGAFDPTVGPLVEAYGFRPGSPRAPDEAERARILEHVGWEKLKLFPESESVRFLDDQVELDLGGIAKGYALDVAARSFSIPGVDSGLLDLGGTVYAFGMPSRDEEWTVALRDPQLPDGSMGVVLLKNRALSTSAIYENAFTLDGVTYGHILDAKTGRPADTDVISASVISDSAAEADALSTAFFVAGSYETGEMLRRAVRIEALMLVKGEEGPVLLVSGSLRGRFQVDPAFAARIGNRVRYILPPSSI